MAFNDKQQAFISWYVKLLNGTRAAERAGYVGDANTLGVTAHDLLTNPNIRAEIDRLLKASIPSADEILSRIGQQATVDVTPYVKDDGSLDIKALSAAGLGHIVVGIEPGSNGAKVTLTHPQTAQKMLARYHRLLSTHLDVDVTAETGIDPDTLASLATQIAAAQRNIAEQDDTE